MGPDSSDIYQTGGAGDDTLRIGAGEGDDFVRMNAGAGKDSMTYDVYPGNDEVFLDGGTGKDALTINGGRQNFTVVNAQGQVLYHQGSGGTRIALRNVECLKVLGPEGEVLFQSGC